MSNRNGLPARISLAFSLLALVALAGCSVSVGNPGGPPPPGPRYESVTWNAVNVRAMPSIQAGIVGALTKGERVEILGQEGNWIHIRNGQGMDGWAYGAYLTGFNIPIPPPAPGQDSGPAPTAQSAPAAPAALAAPEAKPKTSLEGGAAPTKIE